MKSNAGRKAVAEEDKIVNHSIGTTQNEWEQLVEKAKPLSVGKYIVKKLKIKNVPVIRPDEPDPAS